MWTSVLEVSRVAGVDKNLISDANITDFIKSAQKEVNSNVIEKVTREPVKYIDKTRKNDINGTNKTFFVSKWKGNYLADYNFDGEVDLNDLTVWSVDEDGTEVVETIESIDIPNCSFTLETAPENKSLYVTYAFLPLDPVTPDGLLNLATTYLAASYIFVGDDTNNIRFGNVVISSGEKGKGKQLYEKYLEIKRDLTENTTGGAIWGISEVRI